MSKIEELINKDAVERSLSIDRCDIFENYNRVYPESYQNFQKSIENIFFKSELLLKCKFEFERLIIIAFPETSLNKEVLNKDLNLTLIFTGAIKSGKSSLINMLLNTKVMPTNIIGSSCCVHMTHPKSGTKLISVGVLDLEGWEVDKCMDLDISECPKKIESFQYSLAKKSSEKGDKHGKRIQVQLPHWLLKNINIYECPAIDGIYSFDEPFDIIEQIEHKVLVHVIDASNGLMQWDRTFLAKIQHKWPQLPIFFVINHVDVQQEIMARDNCIRFESVSDKLRLEHLESESSDQYSTEDAELCFASGVLSEDGVLKQEKYLIEKTKKQLKTLGFMLENKSSTHYAALSVKEFIKLLNTVEEKKNGYWEYANEFFINFSNYLSTWLENLLITSSLELKCRVNGVVDAARCQIMYPNELLQDIKSDTYFQDIKKAQNKIKDEFVEIHNELDKQLTKSVKEQLKKHEEAINKSLPDLSTEDNSQIIHIIKPKLLDSFEKILLHRMDEYNLNDEIIRILDGFYRRLETMFIKLYKPNKMLSFFEYILNLFRTLQRTTVYTLILCLPHDIIQSENKWYKELMKKGARKLLGASASHQSLVVELINDIKVTPIIKTAQVDLADIDKQIQNFTKKYQDAYRMTRSWMSQVSTISPEVFKKLLLVDFVIKVIEKSFQKRKNTIEIANLKRIPAFHNDFYEHESCMIKCVNIQSFTFSSLMPYIKSRGTELHLQYVTLRLRSSMVPSQSFFLCINTLNISYKPSLADAINILCIKRVCRPRQNIMSHKSTTLLENGRCLLFYSKMDYDLFSAMENAIKWQITDIIGIIKQLLSAVKCLLTYSHYLQIEFYPENIMLKKYNKGLHECIFFPFTDENPSIRTNYLMKRKFQNSMNRVVCQLGLVLTCLLTNDVSVSDKVNDDPECENTFQCHVTSRTLEHLKQSHLITVAMKFLFKSDDYNNTETVIKELDDIKDI